MKADQLETEFAKHGVPNRGGLLLLSPRDAIALVRRAADEGVPILGVDGLRVTEATTTAPLERLVDFSRRVADGHGCWEEAESFIEARLKSGFVFELTLGDDPLEAV
jgi:hypothetical protein